MSPLTKYIYPPLLTIAQMRLHYIVNQGGPLHTQAMLTQYDPTETRLLIKTTRLYQQLVGDGVPRLPGKQDKAKQEVTSRAS
jgi:hypothetical protein